jgi:hypothetical protein
MSLFIVEAVVIGFKEALKLALVWLVFSAFLLEQNRQKLIIPFYWGVFLTFLLSLVSFFIHPDLFVKDVFARLIGYTFFVFFIGSVAALYQSSGVRLFRFRLNDTILRPVVLLLTVFYFLPDIVGSSLFIRELSLMKESYAPVYVSALTGFVVTLAAVVAVAGRFRRTLGKFFGIAQFLLFLSVVKLLGGGIKGFAELSLIPSVERGVIKFVHDVVHQTFVFLMVPDHPLLRVTVWNFIGILFSSSFALWIVLLVVLTPPVMFLYRSFTARIPEPEGVLTGAEKRKIKASIKRDRLRKAVPVAFFVCIILVSWFSGRGEQVSRFYNPKPKPVVEDKGVVIIPLTDPAMDLMDGKLHKFSLLRGEDTVVIIVIKKPDGKLAVCLDACEICPPEGYGQIEDNVVCIYCRTPIPIETLGQKGGCNPIPLKATMTDRDIRIDVSEIDRLWQDVRAGKTKEIVK